MKIAIFSTGFCGLVAGEITVRELKTAFENSRDGINRYLNDNFQYLPYEHLTEFDEFTSIGSKLDSKNSRILSKNIPNAFALFKKLNIRALLYGYSKMQDDFEFQYQVNGLYAFFLKEYGCFCLPNQQDKDMLHGQPVDELDEICKNFQLCKSCLGYDGCNISETSYEWTLNKGARDISCKDSRDSCSRNLCECEADLARQLVQKAHLFNPSYSGINGFDRQESCRAQQGSHQIPTQKMTTTTTIGSTTTETSSTTTTTDFETFSSNPDYYQSTTEPNTVALELFNYEDLNIDMEELMDLFNGLTTTSPLVAEKEERSKPIKMTSGGSSRIFGKFVEDAPVLKSAFSAPKIELPQKLSATTPTTRPKTPTTPFIPSEPKCCGDYPNMKLYNPDRRKCCDGRIRSLGSC